ncbi:hypothetical protein [Pseudolactococcus raffinolactis]|uniref:hypothetical protein n=1 Tax=Pseudolactococcus raffinolactis TaxID=1366 RepID=UPI001C6FDCD6|nr:hypothetical protein [Lactococcus raffinolactis]
MVEIKKLMQKNDDGTSDQFYPETHVAAILGLSGFLKDTFGTGIGVGPGVSSVNGKTGVVFITQKDLGIVLATSKNDGLLSSELYQKIKELIDSPSSSNPDRELSAELVSDRIYQLSYKNEEFNPKTTIEAVDGLEEALTESGIKGDKGDPGEQGPPGTAENLTLATEETDGLMSKTDKQQVNRLSKYSFIRTGEI